MKITIGNPVTVIITDEFHHALFYNEPSTVQTVFYISQEESKIFDDSKVIIVPDLDTAMELALIGLMEDVG